MRILLVDDEKIIRETLSSMLIDLGYEVECADSGQGALDVLNTAVPDLVVSDIRMPGMDGLELLNWLHVCAPELPVIVITGQGNEDTERAALRCGAYKYLCKPVSLRELVGLISQVERDLSDAKKMA